MKSFNLSLFVLILILSGFTSTDLSAQTKLLGRAAKFVGKTIATSAIESIVGNEIDKHYFQANQSTQTQYGQRSYQGQYASPKAITVAIVNDNPYYAANFWVTNDGYNWYPRSLYPGYNTSVSSGSSGVIGVFDGHRVWYLNRAGTYYTSNFR